MSNPRYSSPRQDKPSGRESRLQALAQLQEGDQRQQQLDLATQSQQGQNGAAAQQGLMQMLTSLYGIQQEQEAAPLKAGLLQAQTQEAQNRSDLYGRDKQNDPKLDQYIRYAQATGLPPEVAQKYTSVPQYQAGMAADKKQKDLKQYYGLEQQAKQGQLTPDDFAGMQATQAPETINHFRSLAPPPKPPAEPGILSQIASGLSTEAVNYLQAGQDLIRPKQPTAVPLKPPTRSNAILDMYVPSRGQGRVY